MKTLLISSSLFGANGQSTTLANELAARLGGKVVVRDVTKVPHLDGERFAAFNTPAAARTPAQQAAAEYSDELIAELKAADAIVIGVPMYNFGIPSTLKAYFDHVARAGITFKYTEKGAVGLLTGKKAYLVLARGGHYGDTHAHTSYVRDFLAFIGISDLETVYAEGLAISPASKDAGLAKARAQIERLNEREPALI
ncbi:MAG TPA: NAD(P)H-dependent oxidoreductase [Burkholderiales bacterium]|nr:NAD(P)H-dependent oxidoreductase [Burkholderiales bacterium]